MTLENIVLHQIIKEEGGEPALNCSNQLLPVDSEDIIDFVTRFLKIYNRRRPTQGSFKEDSDNYPFQTYVKDFIDENDDFLTFSKKAMKTLEKAIKLPTTKGGYVVFIHYKNGENSFIVTTMLDNSSQFAVDEDELNIEKLTTLNLDELVRANRVNISKWNAGEDAYLTFIKGKREVSKFFQTFIGNTDLTSSKINANNLKDSLSEFMREQNYTRAKKSSINTKIKQYVDRMIDQEKDIELTSVSALVNPDTPDEFIEYTIVNEKPVSGSFRSTKKSDFSFLHQSIVKGDGFKLTFEKRLIQTGKINRQGNNLIITEVDPEILNREFGNGN